MPLKKLKIPLIIFLCLTLFILLAPAIHAQATKSILPDCVIDGRCSLCDIMQTFITFGKWLLGIVGSLALLMFVYGGFVFLTSGGEAARVDSGKKILVNSVIGVAITFFAWTIVAFVVGALTTQSGTSFNGQTFALAWQGTLTCAALPEMKDPVIEDRGDGTQGKKKEGEECKASSECEDLLYCDKTTTPAKCAKQIADSQSCKNKEISGNDNLACQSDSCGGLGAALLPGIACTDGTCCPSANAKPGKQCKEFSGMIANYQDKCTDDYFCATVPYGSSSDTGTCTKKLVNSIGSSCLRKFVVGGDEDSICASGRCDSTDHICVPAIVDIHAQPLNIGEICSDTLQCKNHCFSPASPIQFIKNFIFCSTGQTYCYSSKKKGTHGVCASGPIPDEQICDQTVVIYGAANPNAPCKSSSDCKAPPGILNSWTGVCTPQ